MEEDLITKKELLQLTNISYGQLYRWKRKKLIPEEWFIRKATFTGQETFFPRDKILGRIDKIKNMKAGLSLDEIADQMSAHPIDINLSPKEALEQNIVSKTASRVFNEQYLQVKSLSFPDLLTIYMVDKALQTGTLSIEESQLISQTMKAYYPLLNGRNAELVMLRKYGMTSCLLQVLPGEIFIEQSTTIVVRLNVATYTEQLKIKLSELRRTSNANRE
ncbi:hypothetical protein GCM10011391_15210 [Pullulanibacillus camelliae]|uniref:DUF4004 family protein n=1 Tax=Pullulanibacillus camelliae TaxID=1707096 RepID=A0A8J2VQY7_9BACL|nr:YhbD family protein [Pullulanibacillus camelliae]GGE37256.1 hypothetical protein GCM10011391_15210 [Pullulanibacillus camelliae]